MATFFVLKYTDENADCTVTLHYDLEDAQVQRAYYIAEMVTNGVVDDGECADLITAHLMQGDFVLAYECFMQWSDRGDIDYGFDITESRVCPPISLGEVVELLLGGEPVDSDTSAVEIIDLRPKTPEWRQVIDQLGKDGDVLKGTLDTNLDKLERELANGYSAREAMEDAITLKKFLSTDHDDETPFSYDGEGNLVEDPNGDFNVVDDGKQLQVVPRRIDGNHKGRRALLTTMLDAVMKQRLTESEESAKQEDRPHPVLGHNIKGRSNGKRRPRKNVSV